MTTSLLLALLLCSALAEKYLNPVDTAEQSADEIDNPEGGTIFPDEADYNDLPEGPEDAPSLAAREVLPTNFTYRRHKCIQIINQGSCGCCYAAATVEMVTARRCLHFGDSRLVSLEDLVSCDNTKYMNIQNNGCRGGNSLASLKFGETTGMVFDTCEKYWNRSYPYPKETCKKTCANGKPKEREAKNKAPYRLSGVDAMMRDIYKNGPITVSMYLANDFPPKDRTAIYVSSSKTKLSGGHAVMIVGWGEENGVPYWDCANTYGINWGDKGYFRIKRGTNELKIESWPGSALPIAPANPEPEPPAQGSITVEAGKTYIAGYELSIPYSKIAAKTELQLWSTAGKKIPLTTLSSSSGTARVTVPKDTAAGQYYFKAGDNGVASATFSVAPHFALSFDKSSYQAESGKSITFSFTKPLQTACRLSSGSTVLAELRKDTGIYTLTSSLPVGKTTLTLTTVDTVPALSATASVTITGAVTPELKIFIKEPVAGASVTLLSKTMRVSYTSTDLSAPVLLQSYCNGRLKEALAAGLSNSGSVDIRLPSSYEACTTFYLRLRSETSPFTYADVGPINIVKYEYKKDDLPAPTDKKDPEPKPEPEPEPTPTPDPEPEPEPTPTPTPTGNDPIHITNPNTGSVWAPGNTVTIRWSSNLTDSATMTILLYETVGTTNYLRHTFTRNAPNTGVYTDQLPLSVPSGPKYFIRMRSSSPMFTNTSDTFAVKAARYAAKNFPTVASLDEPLEFSIYKKGFSLFHRRPHFIIELMQNNATLCTFDDPEGKIGHNTIYLEECLEKISSLPTGYYCLRMCTHKKDCFTTPQFELIEHPVENSGLRTSLAVLSSVVAVLIISLLS